MWRFHDAVQADPVTRFERRPTSQREVRSLQIHGREAATRVSSTLEEQPGADGAEYGANDQPGSTLRMRGTAA